MRRLVMILVMMMVAAVTFADARTDAKAAMEKARTERQEAWNELFNYKPMSWDEFKAEYQKNHFALSKYDNVWSANLSKAFKEYQDEVKQTRKELWNIYNEAEAKEKEANAAYLNIVMGETK